MCVNTSFSVYQIKVSVILATISVLVLEICKFRDTSRIATIVWWYDDNRLAGSLPVVSMLYHPASLSWYRDISSRHLGHNIQLYYLANLHPPLIADFQTSVCIIHSNHYHIACLLMPRNEV